MDGNVSSINRSAYPHLENVTVIKYFLVQEEEAANTIVLEFISSQLDAGNSILYGYTMQTLIHTQNTASGI